MPESEAGSAASSIKRRRRARKSDTQQQGTADQESPPGRGRIGGTSQSQYEDDMRSTAESRVVVMERESHLAPLGYNDPFKMTVAPPAWEQELASEVPQTVVEDPLSGQEAAGWDMFPQGDPLLFWGSDVKLSEYGAMSQGFFETWVKGNETGAAHYHQEMTKMFLNGATELDVSLTHMKEYSEDLYKNTVKYPLEAIPLLQEQANVTFQKVVQILDEHDSEIPKIDLRICGMPAVTNLRGLTVEDLGNVVCVNGMVVRVSKILPEMKVALFECRECFHKEMVQEERGKIEEPVRCSNCGKHLGFELKHNQCHFTDKQFVRLQESPDATPEGETPASVSITLYSSLVDSIVPGDRVELTGVYKSAPVRVSGNSRICKSVFKTFVDATHVLKTSKGKQSYSFSEEQTAEQDQEDPQKAELVDRIHEASKQPDLYKILTRSIAPGIHGMEDVKLGVLCQLFGGTAKSFTMCSTRSEINILLCGDPGVAKSQILTHVNSITTRGIYTSGKGSSSVGLTAYVARDADTGEFVLESGALVLSDKGICCIDEFDKMDDSTRSVLHEVMEQQTVSIAKAGIICTLNARSSILAAANPKESTWNKDQNILKNLDISSTLLSRFDLIYLLLDLKDTALDRALSLHICKLYTALGMKVDDKEAETKQAADSNNTAPLATGPPGLEIFNLSSLTKYVSYAKARIRPRLSKDASSKLVQCYVEMRKSRGGRNVVTATTRQLEAMIRISEAHAKMRLSNEVTTHDVLAAKKLIETALKDSCIDKETGMLISAGGDSHSGVTTATIIRHIQDLVVQNKWSKQKIPMTEVKNQVIDCLQNGISKADLSDACSVLLSRGIIDPIVDDCLPFK